MTSITVPTHFQNELVMPIIWKSIYLSYHSIKNRYSRIAEQKINYFMAKGKSIVLWEIILIESVCEIFDLSLCYRKKKYEKKKHSRKKDEKCEDISDYT